MEERQLVGRLDALTSSGFAEGWAFDAARPDRVVEISVGSGEREVASGLANLWRPDLAQAGCNAGWCAFRVRVEADVPNGQGLWLAERPGGQRIGPVVVPGTLPDGNRTAASVLDLIGQDPTVLAHIDQLAACGALFDAFVARCGIERFVRNAYLYVLHRPADEAGLVDYADELRRGDLSPFRLLQVLASSQEFLDGGRLLSAPSTAGFPFRAA